MHFLTSWFIRNPVAANLLMAFILLSGLVTLNTMRIEGFPRVEPDSITITTLFNGAPPEKVDILVSQKIENALEGIDGVHSISAMSIEGVSTVTVKKSSGQDIQKLLDKIRLKMESGVQLPANAERPSIETNGFNFPALYINIHGKTDRNTLNKLAKRLKESLLAEPELSRLKIWGLHKQEIRIEVDSKKLHQLNLTVADIADLIRSQSLEFQAGSLKTQSGNIYIKADKEAQHLLEYLGMPIIQNTNGDVVRLQDIAKVYDSFEEGDFLFRFNGLPTAGMEVLVGHKENLLHISEVTRRVIKAFTSQLPQDVEITVWGDSSDYIADRLNLLVSNGFQGLILVILILALFLDVKLAFWISMGIPVSVMGAIALSGTAWVGYSLNDITTFGFIIALGILVDDAVVVGESVYEQRRLNPDPILGTEQGVSKVAVATIFGVLTTVAAFFPMLMLDNPLGKVLSGFSGVMIFALLFSLLESKFILPAHLAGIDIEKPSQYWWSKMWQKCQYFARSTLHLFRDRLYFPILISSVRHRYSIFILFICTAVLVLGLALKGKIKTSFFPDVPGQMISIQLEMDPRAPFELTRRNLEHIRTAGITISEELKDKYQIENAPIQTMFEIIMGADSAQLYAELTPIDKREEVKVQEIVNLWRSEIGSLEGATEIHLSGSEEIGGGFAIKLLAHSKESLEDASSQLKDYLSSIEGVYNPRDSMAEGLISIKLNLKEQAKSLGFDMKTLATQIGLAYGGAELHKLQRDNNELSVVIKRQANQRSSINDLLNTYIRSPKGTWVSLDSIAEIEQSLKPKLLMRENNQLLNTVFATIDRNMVSPQEVSQAVMEHFAPAIMANHPDLKIHLGGELEEMGEMRGGLKKALIFAVVLIYVLMAVPLKSYWLPFIILAIIPFGFVGAILGHLYLDLSVSVLSLFGMLALSGVVVNDSLVMLTRYNDLREAGIEHIEAIQEAAKSRFQAIFLTTATTVIGLLPLLSETSEQAQYLKPAAASLAYGELFSTLLMLILVPVLIAITHDIKRLFLVHSDNNINIRSISESVREVF